MNLSAPSRLGFPITFALFAVSLQAQVPATDSRNTDIPNTDTHFSARTYKTLAEWQERRAHLRKQVLSAAGLLPIPPKTPLHAEIFGRIENRTYSIEKVLLETLPGYFLGGNLYRPLNQPAPAGGFPAVVSPHGHWNYGRLEHTPVASVPARCINLAQQGYVVFAYDMVGYNDTIQTPHDFGGRAEELWDFGPFSLQLWNSIRAVDFVESLPGVNPQRIGATGASGGGTQTFSLTAVDDRIQFSAPVNMISAIMQGGGQCENAPNLRLDTFNVEIASIFAPKPMIMLSATGDWTRNTMTEEYPAVKAIYGLYGQSDKVEAVLLDAPHNYNQQAREAVYKFFGKHVLGETDPAKFKERGVRIEKLRDMLVLHNRKLPDNALDYDGLFAEWKRIGRETAAAVTDGNEIREMLEFALGAGWPTHVTAETKGDTFALTRPGRGDRVAGIFHPGKGANILIVHPDGAEALRKSNLFNEFVQSGRPIYAIDAFQTGAAVAPRNREAKMFLTFNRSDDANRVQDILTTLAWMNSPNVEVVGVGKASVWCLFAASVSRRSVILHPDIPKPGGVDRDYYDNFFVPGIERAGGLRAAKLLTNQ
jgi:dienelactone hydrolase